ncbi:cob(I)yrinic acid a,c-diamide adenosyltransferase [Ktedonosporobacter rubrisoli]|uniref:Cob(I)yrinic acid a,c-diamide adenosyltransferase n=1 Tax=Ktedonosporobacter rubrisoli TaxID=2509675 RepID=A0A4P6JQN9_KTERU|nr:cob(I)yrinic acid a,c-diamide adenosyltransferase [Ktedonosporobacter rubrisoli]QBD77614.1 cob(I)yrinic acid a,c-diamide adenosyltransferase [Ktedonosporobacter rubrisoli]
MSENELSHPQDESQETLQASAGQAEEFDPEEDKNLTEEERILCQRVSHEKRRQRAKTAIKKGVLIVNTGKGKGKTTAALGLLVRAWGQGLRVCMLQFIKAQTGNWGEEKAARKIGLEVIPLGSGFTWLSKDLEKDKALARQGWEQCSQKILSGNYDLIVLDEMTYILKYGWITWEEVRATLDQRPAGMHLIITGRYAPPELLEYADTVSEVVEVKHHYHAGVKAQKGIEF